MPGYYKGSLSQASLADTHPDVAAQAVGWNPSGVSFGSHARRLWKCAAGHTWEAEVRGRALGTGCPYCAGKSALPDFNDLATVNPAIAAEADGWDPTTVTAGSGSKRDWVCVIGHRYQMSIVNRSKGSGCPYCAGRRVLPGFNDLATKFPAIAAEADGWNPSEIVARADRDRTWRGLCGHRWTAKVAARTVVGTGCPACATYGFNPDKPAWVYVLVGFVRGRVVVQFGITNVPDVRLSAHRRSGFRSDPIALVAFARGRDAAALERQLRAQQRERSLPTAMQDGIRFNGATEAFVWRDAAIGFADELCTKLGVDPEVLRRQVQTHLVASTPAA